MKPSKVKVRVAGLYYDERGFLVAQHKGHDFHTLIGGSWEVGETLEEGLKREFLEETGLQISVTRLIFIGQMLTFDDQVLDMIFEVKPKSYMQSPVCHEKSGLVNLGFYDMSTLRQLRLGPVEFWEHYLAHSPEENTSTLKYFGKYPREG